MKPGFQAPLLENHIPLEPWELFARWVSDAENALLPEPTAMTLATATPQGVPSARMVLLRGFDARGLAFYTNYLSRKAGELEENPRAALVFFWATLHRQIRVEGTVEKVTPAESDVYFQSRPRGHRLGAHASPQSQVIADRDFLEKQMNDLVRQFENQDVPRPEHWGGYRVVPQMFEFWQGQENRLHDRLRYRLLTGGTWVRDRLAP